MIPQRHRIFEQIQLYATAYERTFSLGVAFVIGIVAGFSAIAVRLLIEGAHHIFWRVPELVQQLGAANWFGVLLVPALGGLVVGPIIYLFAREARGHGVPEVMAAIITKGGFIRPRVALIKALASAITIGSGGSVGREGPIIQIGSSIGSTFGFLLHLPPRLMRTFVACGAAGGIAATFNAPIAGALFAVEIILGDFGFISLAPIVTSSVIATVVARGFEGDLAAFVVPHYSLVHPVELVFYLGLGLLCGLVAVMFIVTLDRLETLFDDRLKIHQAVGPMVGGLVIGAVGIFFPQVFGVGYETMNSALRGEMAVGLVFLLILVKMFATSVTLASGGSGGIFAPSLFMGAMTGSVVGHAANRLLPEITASPGAYALVGMGALVGAATHAPITAIVMIFEMTNDYKIILPLMISTIVGVLTSNYLHRESIYTHKLKRKGVILEKGMESNLLKSIKVQDVMRRGFESVPHDLPFNFLIDVLLQTARSRVAVVDDDGGLVGVIPREMAQKFLSEKDLLSELIIARDLVVPDPSLLYPEDTLELASLRFQEYDCRELFVVDGEQTRRLVGMVRKGDLMDAYQREMIKLESGATFAYNINRRHRMEPVNVMDGYGILEVEAPHEFSGKRLRDLDLRNRFGINVLAIKRSGGVGRNGARMWVPESSDALEDGDVLVVLGETEVINNLRSRW